MPLTPPPSSTRSTLDANKVFLARVHLDLIDRHTTAIQELTDRIEVVVEPFRGFPELICTIPGSAQSSPM